VIHCTICNEEASSRANGQARTPYQHNWGPTTHDFRAPKEDRYTYENGRRYKRGYAPSELMHPIQAICGRCGGLATIYPRGLVCGSCTPSGVEDAFANDLDRARVRIGAMPESELL
jgi:hypothetical protein